MNGGVELILRSGPGIIGRLLTYETFAMKLKETYTEHVDWYLYNLSVSRKAQGRGIASKLLRPMLEFCDREKMVCYLETNKESNVTLYQRYGFQLAEQSLVPRSDVMHYAMTRNPEGQKK
jgi:ribosomal protein S18 acetylase RimI-like enzyme